MILALYTDLIPMYFSELMIYNTILIWRRPLALIKIQGREDGFLLTIDYYKRQWYYSLMGQVIISVTTIACTWNYKLPPFDMLYSFTWVMELIGR